jgi:hypothetical protein
MNTKNQDLDFNSAVPVPSRRAALEQVKRSPGFPGICEECGCTERNACTAPGGWKCGWANEGRTLCTNPACLQSHRAKVKAARPAIAIDPLLTAIAEEAQFNHENAAEIVAPRIAQFLLDLGDGAVECESVSQDIEGVVFRFSDGFKVGWRHPR